MLPCAARYAREALYAMLMLRRLPAFADDADVFAAITPCSRSSADDAFFAAAAIFRRHFIIFC